MSQSISQRVSSAVKGLESKFSSKGNTKAATKSVSKKSDTNSGGLQVKPVNNPKMSGVWQPSPDGSLKASRNPVGKNNINPQLGKPPLTMSKTVSIRSK